jgi:nucleoside-diphosphate-sugar epimerase
MNGPVAITGATGFAGQHLIARLDKMGAAMRLLVRAGPRTCGFGNAETIIGSLEDAAALKSLVNGASAVIHLAGATAAPDRRAYFRTNAEGSERLADIAIAAGVRRFIHVSSLAAREPALSAYGASKREAEERLLARKDRLQLAILRPPAVYGPGDRSTLPLLAQLVRRVALIPGTRIGRFSLIQVEDLARLLADSLASDLNGIYEVSDGTAGGYGWKDLIAAAVRSEGRAIRPIFMPRAAMMAIATVAAAVSKKPPVTPDKVRELYHENWVVQGGLAADKPVTFADGFTRTIAWYREQGWLPRRAGADTRQAHNKQGEPAR